MFSKKSERAILHKVCVDAFHCALCRIGCTHFHFFFRIIKKSLAEKERKQESEDSDKQAVYFGSFYGGAAFIHFGLLLLEYYFYEINNHICSMIETHLPKYTIT